jgi:hypothetical protein
MHIADPVNNNARTIASQFGMSIPRVEAVLKLKFFEEEMKQVCGTTQSIPNSFPCDEA